MSNRNHLKTVNRVRMNPKIIDALKLLLAPLLIVLAGCSSLEKREVRYAAGVDRARPFIEGRQDYDQGLKCLDNLENMCATWAKDSHTSEKEKVCWQERIEYIRNSRAIIVSEYNAALKQMRTLVNAKQREFVCLQATEDLRAARAIADGQNGKWFNWFGLRDDRSEWAKAANLCDRVLGDTRINHILNLAAARQKYDCERRLGKKGRGIYANLNALPDYATFNGFPAFGEEEITGSAKKIWSQNEKPLPLFEEDSSDTMPSTRKGCLSTSVPH